jgi:PAS domain S-box-containing protein
LALPPRAAPDERKRLEALHRLAVLDTLPEPVFDAITAAAAQVCQVPIALVSLIDAERQWFKSNVGLAGTGQTPREVAFCDHAIRGEQLLEVADAALDPRFAHNPLVTGEPNIRFYGGAPIVMPGGERIGTVCVIDREPRRLSDLQRATLQSLGRIASACLAERSRHVAMTRELAASESRYRAIVEDQSELISLAGRNRTLTFVNPAYARHFGREPAQMVGHDLLDFVDEADRAAVVAHWQRVCGQDAPISNVNRMRSAQGRACWVAWTNRTLRDAAGQVVSVQSVGRDITDQSLAEQALAESERRYRGLYESTPVILHSIDAQGRLLNVSDRWLQVMGYAREEVIGRFSSEFLTPESARHAREAVLPEFFHTGRCDRVPYQFVRKDGAVVDILLSAILERDEQGLPFRSLAALEDVTETRRMAAELGRTHARLDAIVDNVPALLGHWDRDGITRFANRELQAAAGLQPEQIIGLPLQAIYDAVDPQGYPLLAPRVAAVLQGERQDFELPVHTGSGLRQLRMTLVPDQPPHGPIAGFYGMAHDITQRMSAERRLQEALKEKETLLKEVYHRVKNNLQVVQSLLNLQRRSLPEGLARVALDESVQRVRAMALVHEKLYQAGNLAVVMLPHYTEDLLAQLAEANGVAQRQILLSADIAPVNTGLDGAIPFGLLVTELVSNALKHAFHDRSGGEVRVGLVQQAGGALLSVSDNGTGLAPGFDLATCDSMGLQLARSLARQLGGELYAADAGGAAFRALLTRL